MYIFTKLELAAIIYLAIAFGATVGMLAVALVNSGRDENDD